MDEVRVPGWWDGALRALNCSCYRLAVLLLRVGRAVPPDAMGDGGYAAARGPWRQVFDGSERALGELALRLAGMSLDTVQRSVRALEAAGFAHVTRDHRGGMTAISVALEVTDSAAVGDRKSVRRTDERPETGRGDRKPVGEVTDFAPLAESEVTDFAPLASRARVGSQLVVVDPERDWITGSINNNNDPSELEQRAREGLEALGVVAADELVARFGGERCWDGLGLFEDLSERGQVNVANPAGMVREAIVSGRRLPARRLPLDPEQVARAGRLAAMEMAELREEARLDEAEYRAWKASPGFPGEDGDVFWAHTPEGAAFRASWRAANAAGGVR